MASRRERTSSTIGPKQYSFEELATATGRFSRKNLLGEGGYGEVFKGFLDEHRAIKKLRIISSDEQRKKELEYEIKVINSVSHRNLVKLVGYCIEENDVLLVLEYFPNKCLKYNLHERKERILVWQERMQIAKGLAKGLEYLHEDCNFRIIHQDIKPGNILLDDNFEAKIADFGLALFLPNNATHVSQSAVGTEVYMEKSKRISEKSDVYSFGVVLLELITGRKPICEGIDIVNWAKNPIKRALKGQYLGFVDSKLQSYNVEEIKLMICCAEHCVYKPSTDRPRIREIVRVLEGFIPPQDKDANDFLQHRVQKLSIIPETDDNDSVDSEVYSKRMFSYQQLERATQGFSQFLGEGSLGLVYKGYLDDKEVAVRQLKDLPDEKQKENLEKDIKIIGSVNHPNLVRQIGYSIQGLNRFLALEFFPSISLKSLLHGNRTLEWSKRVKIAIDSAKGLEYLHENCKIVHGDIMTNNILVDNNFRPKVTNFGLIKYYRSERPVVYADPEDRKGISAKSDIYAFGVVLLELITGIESRKKGTNNIVNRAKTLMRRAMKKEYTTIFDPTLQGNYNKIEMERMLCCAAACVYKPSAFRPQIKKIVGVLEGSIPRKDIWDESDNQFLSNTIVKESPPLLTKPEKMAEEGKVIACHTVKDWKKQYKRGKRLIVVDFSASWCGPSRFMSPILAGWAKLMPNVRFLTVDVDELSSVARKWAIEAMPTFLLLKRGKLLEKVVGAKVQLLQLTIARHAGGAHRTLGPEVLNPAIFPQPTNVYVTLPTGYAQPQFIGMTSVQNPQMFPPYPNYPN